MTHKPRRFDLNPDNFIAGITGQLTPAELGVYWLMCLLFYSHAGPFTYDERRFKLILAGTNWKTFRTAFSKLVKIGKLRLLDAAGNVTDASLEPHCGLTVDALSCHSPLTEASLRLHWALTNGALGGRPSSKNNGLGKPHGYEHKNPSRAPDSTTTITTKEDSDKSESFAQAAKRRLSEFDEFWIQFPRKVGKRTARLAFERAVKRSAPATITEGAKHYAASRAGEDEHFTAHPSTWLNRDGWLDAPATTVAVPQPCMGLGPELEERERQERLKRGIGVVH